MLNKYDPRKFISEINLLLKSIILHIVIYLNIPYALILLKYNQFIILKTPPTIEYFLLKETGKS